MATAPVAEYRSFRASVIDAWAHLTRPELLGRWLGNVNLELIPGGELLVEQWNGDTARGRVISVAPPVRLDLAWRPSMLSPEARVSFRLEGDGPGGRLHVTHEGLRSEAERAAARQSWREALLALRASLQGATDANAWGASIPIALRALLPRTADDLWPLIATAPGINKWVANVERFEGEPGGSFRLTSRYQGRQVVEEGRVEALDPGKRIALSWEWAGEGWGAPTTVEFSIEEEPTGSSLIVSHAGFDRIAPEQRLAARRNYAAAWPEVLADLRRLVAPVAV